MFEEPFTPDREVWQHLQEALAAAKTTLSEHLADDEYALMGGVANWIVEGRLSLLSDPQGQDVPLLLRNNFPAITTDQWRTLLSELQAKKASEWPPWLRYGVDCSFATLGTSRAMGGLARYERLRPLQVAAQVPQKVQDYLREAVQAFLFQFDDACIALCRACFDQMAKAALVGAGHLTKPAAEKSHLMSYTLARDLKLHGLITTTEQDAAERLATRGNNVMHKGLTDRRIAEEQALSSLQDLTVVGLRLAEFLP